MSFNAPETISTEGAPPAIGPYAQAVRHGGVVYCSGQVGRVPGATGLVGEDVGAQTRQCLANLVFVLDAAGSGLNQVLSASVFLVDMADFTAMNQVYAEIFGSWTPARATVAVAALPLGARVEISVVAAVRSTPVPEVPAQAY